MVHIVATQLTELTNGYQIFRGLGIISELEGALLLMHLSCMAPHALSHA